MKLELRLVEDFGATLVDGYDAARYRHGRIEPFVDMAESIVLDFTSVRTANSSFINALIAGLVEQHGERLLQKMTFKGCNPVIQVLVEAAIDLGLQKSDERVRA